MRKIERLTAIVSTGGRVTLPAAIRQQRRWTVGTTLIVEEADEGVLLRAAPLFAQTTMDEVFGCLPFSGGPKTIEDMDAGVSSEIKRRHCSH